VTTPSQTVGPFYSIGCCRRDESTLVDDGVTLSGALYDGAGEPIRDGLIELWDGRHWGRCGTDAEGGFTFVVPLGAAHLEAYVFARGLLKHQWTRIYLPGQTDTVLDALPPERRETLVAEREGDGLRFDIHMQGDRETVFFAT
jgi:protocatechuate 3,4-dioxygenase alpha subunit